nr:DUF423 domain-containing protein [uncultured Flavobacterium sp.]
MDKKILATAAFLGMTGILLGAFGAHGLKKIVEPDAVASFENGVRYQIYHALFLLFVGTTTFLSESAKKQIFTLVVIGVAFFSVSIYFLALRKYISFDIKKFGIITPIGGLLLIGAWGILFLNIIKRK